MMLIRTISYEKYWKTILNVDDGHDIITNFKVGIENDNINNDKMIEVRI